MKEIITSTWRYLQIGKKKKKIALAAAKLAKI
jgi:hypothetical protein